MWEKVIFTDEASLEIGEDPKRTYVSRRPGEEILQENLVPTFRSGRKSLMVWAAIAYGHKWPLLRLPLQSSSSNGKVQRKAEGLTGAKYVDYVLNGPLKAYSDELKAAVGDGVMVVEDGAPSHSSKVRSGSGKSDS